MSRERKARARSLIRERVSGSSGWRTYLWTNDTGNEGRSLCFTLWEVVTWPCTVPGYKRWWLVRVFNSWLGPTCSNWLGQEPDLNDRPLTRDIRATGISVSFFLFFFRDYVTQPMVPTELTTRSLEGSRTSTPTLMRVKYRIAFNGLLLQNYTMTKTLALKKCTHKHSVRHDKVRATHELMRVGGRTHSEWTSLWIMRLTRLRLNGTWHKKTIAYGN